MSALARWGWAVVLIVVAVAVAAAGLIRPDLPPETLQPIYAQPPSEFVDIDGMSIHLRDEGPRDAPAVLLLHGTFASLHTWSGWVAELTETHRVVRIDLPGFGLTGPHPNKDYSLAATLHLLETLRTRLGLKRWAVVGNSLGAGYALAYAQHHPKRISAVGLISGGRIRLSEAEYSARRAEVQAAQANARGGSWIIQALQEPIVRAMLTQVTPQFLVRWALEDVYGNPDQVDEALVNRYQSMLRHSGNRQAFVDRFIKSEGTSPHTETLTTPASPVDLPMPILIQWGEQDTWIDVEQGLTLAAALPTSTLVTYPSLGHVPMEEAPRETAADFLAFLHTGQLTQRQAP